MPPLVVLAVSLKELVAGTVRMMFPLVVISVYVPLRDSDDRVDVTSPLVVDAVTLAQDVQVKYRFPLVVLSARLDALMIEA